MRILPHCSCPKDLSRLCERYERWFSNADVPKDVFSKAKHHASKPAGHRMTVREVFLIYTNQWNRLQHTSLHSFLKRSMYAWMVMGATSRSSNDTYIQKRGVLNCFISFNWYKKYILPIIVWHCVENLTISYVRIISRFTVSGAHAHWVVSTDTPSHSSKELEMR